MKRYAHPENFRQWMRWAERRLRQLDARAGDAIGGGLLGGAAPVGCIQFYAAATAPAGWLLCDGSVYDPVVYAGLFEVIGNSFGGTAAAPLLPDARSRFLRTAGTSTTLGGSDGLPDTSGTRSPRHTHGVGGVNIGTTGSGHTHGIPAQTGGSALPLATGGLNATRFTDWQGHAHSGDTTTTGSGHNHNIGGATDLNTVDSIPYLTLNAIIRV